MNKRTIPTLVVLGLLLLFHSCSDKSKTTDNSIPIVNPKDLTTIDIELHVDKLLVQNTQFNRQTDESEYKTLIIKEIKLFQNKDQDMEYFVVKVHIHEGVPRKDIAEFEEFLKENNVTTILYEFIDSKDQSI